MSSLEGDDGVAAASAAVEVTAAAAAAAAAIADDLPEAAGLKVKTVKLQTAQPADPCRPCSSTAPSNNSGAADGAGGSSAEHAAQGGPNPRSPTRRLEHSKSAKAVLTISNFASELNGNGVGSPKPSIQAPPETSQFDSPTDSQGASAMPSSTSPPLPVPALAPLAPASSQGAHLMEQYSGGVPYHHSPRTSGPGQSRQPRTSSTYTPFMVKAPRHANVDSLNQPPSPLMGSPVSTPTAMMFPQTPFAQHHPHFASPYGSGRYPPNPFAPDHPMSPQTSGPYGYFHPFFNNIQPFSPSMLNQHGSGNMAHFSGQLSRSNSIVQGQFGKQPPPPPGGQPPSARAGRKSTSASGFDAPHGASRLSESSSGPSPPGPGVHAASDKNAGMASPAQQQQQGATAASGNGTGASTSVDQTYMSGSGSGSDGQPYCGSAPHATPYAPQGGQHSPQQLQQPMQYHQAVPVHVLQQHAQGDGRRQGGWAEPSGGAGPEGGAADDSTGAAAAAQAGVHAGQQSPGFVFQNQDGMAMYPGSSWMGMPVAGLNAMVSGQVPLSPGQIPMAPIVTGQMPVALHPYHYMLMVAAQQHQHQPQGMHGHGHVGGVMQGMQPPPPPPKGVYGTPGDPQGPGSMMAHGAPAGFEFPDLSASPGLPHGGPLAVGMGGAMPQMYGSVPIDLRTGRMFVPPPTQASVLSPTMGPGGRGVSHNGVGTPGSDGRGGGGYGLSGVVGGSGGTLMGSGTGIPPRVPRRRNATELKMGPDGLPKLNARQRRTLRRAKERAIKGLMEAGHVLLQKHGHMAPGVNSVDGVDAGDLSGDESGAESSGEGSEDGDLSPPPRNQRQPAEGQSPASSKTTAMAELFPGSSVVSDPTELYLGAAISVASGSAGPKAAAAAAEALSKAAADLEDMDIANLISHLSHKDGGAVDEKLIRDLEIIQNLIGTLKIQATATGPSSPSPLGSASATQQSPGQQSVGQAYLAGSSTQPQVRIGQSGAAGSGSGMRGVRPPMLQLNLASPGGMGASAKGTPARASPAPLPSPGCAGAMQQLFPVAIGAGIGAGIASPLSPKPQTVAATAAAIHMLPPELQGLGQQMKALMEGAQGQALPASNPSTLPLNARSRGGDHSGTAANGTGSGEAMLVDGVSPLAAGTTVAAAAHMLASLSPAAAAVAGPAPAGTAAGALPGSGVVTPFKDVAKTAGPGSPGTDAGCDVAAAKIAAVH